MSELTVNELISLLRSHRQVDDKIGTYKVNLESCEMCGCFGLLKSVDIDHESNTVDLLRSE